MKLPNPERACVPLKKLEGYCLNSAHQRGKDKARVFAACLGLRANDAVFLQQKLLAAARTEEAKLDDKDVHGQRYSIDFDITTSVATARVRSGWIVRSNEDFATLVTCYVL